MGWRFSQWIIADHEAHGSESIISLWYDKAEAVSWATGSRIEAGLGGSKTSLLALMVIMQRDKEYHQGTLVPNINACFV